MSKVSFKNKHAFIKKWALPKIYGKGLVAKVIKKQSSFSKNMVRSPLPCLNPMFAFWFRTHYETPPKLKSIRAYIEFSDGGIASIDKVLETEPHNEDSGHASIEKPIILLFPGGNESTWATKVLTLCSSYLKDGYKDVFVCNYRGRCKTPFKTPQFCLPFGRFNDIQHSVAYIRDIFPDRKIILTGNCFGGQCIIDYLTCHSNKVPDNVIGAIIHSVQWNVCESSKLLMKEPIYSVFMKPWARETKKLLTMQFSEEVTKTIGSTNFKTLLSLTFDSPEDVFTMYKTGIGKLVDGLINDHNDFANISSPHLKVGDYPVIKPLVILNSADDPTSPLSLQEIEELEKDPNICLSLLPCGGHCAYVKSMLPVTNFIDNMMIECSNIVFDNFR